MDYWKKYFFAQQKRKKKFRTIETDVSGLKDYKKKFLVPMFNELDDVIN